MMGLDLSERPLPSPNAPLPSCFVLRMKSEESDERSICWGLGTEAEQRALMGGRGKGEEGFFFFFSPSFDRVSS